MRPSAMYETKDIERADRSAAQDIRQLEALLADLREYRQDLARRYAEIETMPYTLKLYLVREKSWYDKKVTYTVRLAKVMEDGKEVDELRETFTGTNRKAAMERFESLKAERPGIAAVKDIEKKQWEK